MAKKAIVLVNGHLEVLPPGEDIDVTFTSLTDTPSSYTDQAGKVLKVNVGETALVFGDASGFSGDMDDIPNGVTYVKTENNYTDSDAAIVASVTSGLADKLDNPTGTPDGTKYLRDDNTWQPVSGGSGLAQYQVRRMIRR